MRTKIRFLAVTLLMAACQSEGGSSSQSPAAGAQAGQTAARMGAAGAGGQVGTLDALAASPQSQPDVLAAVTPDTLPVAVPDVRAASPDAAPAGAVDATPPRAICGPGYHVNSSNTCEIDSPDTGPPAPSCPVGQVNNPGLNDGTLHCIKCVETQPDFLMPPDGTCAAWVRELKCRTISSYCMVSCGLCTPLVPDAGRD